MTDIINAPSQEDRKKMAIAFMESAAFEGNEMDLTLVSLIRKGMVVFKYPDLFQCTQEGLDAAQQRLDEDA